MNRGNVNALSLEQDNKATAAPVEAAGDGALSLLKTKYHSPMPARQSPQVPQSHLLQ
jgi:hypothetical protein